MIEKKSLNFDFLDQNPKNNEKVNELDVSDAMQNTNTVKFFEYFQECFSSFSKFSKKYLVNKRPKYLLVVIWVIGLGNVAGQLTSSNSTSWGEVWSIAILSGILTGAIAYYIAGWFYYVRVKWSRGNDDIDTARNIYVFTSLPIAIVSVVSLLFNQFAYGSDYFDLYYSDASDVDLIFALLSITAIIYSIYISYHAVRTNMHTEKMLSLVWFIIAPTIFYIAVLANAIS